jgi:hypothetical protein
MSGDLPASQSWSSRPVDELELTWRSANTLTNLEITTVGQLLETPPRKLLKRYQFGRKSFAEIVEALRKAGVPEGEIERWQQSETPPETTVFEMDSETKQRAIEMAHKHGIGIPLLFEHLLAKEDSTTPTMNQEDLGPRKRDLVDKRVLFRQEIHNEKYVSSEITSGMVREVSPSGQYVRVAIGDERVSYTPNWIAVSNIIEVLEKSSK